MIEGIRIGHHDANGAERRRLSWGRMCGSAAQRLFVFAFVLMCAPPFTASARKLDPESLVVSQAVGAVCEAPIVFLGEPGSHDGARVIEVRSRTVQQLIELCGFTHVVFESQLYDFVDLQRRYDAGTATLADLHNAVGGIWSLYAETDPLLAYLHQQASTGAIKLGGMDDAIEGATNRYTQEELVMAMNRFLPAAMQASCPEVVNRYIAWKFDDSHPKDAAFDERLSNCAKTLQSQLETNRDMSPVDRMMVSSFSRHLLLQNDADQAYNLRDRLMADNLLALRAQLPAATKTIVWLASVHAQRITPSAKRVSTAQFVVERIPNARSIAFVGTSGAHGRPPGQPITKIGPPARESVEGWALRRHPSGIAFIGKQALQQLGERESRVLSYEYPKRLRWSDVFDGIFLFGQERAPREIHPRRPMTSADLP